MWGFDCPLYCILEAFKFMSIKQVPLFIIHTILKTDRILPWFLAVGIKISLEIPFPSCLGWCCLIPYQIQLDLKACSLLSQIGRGTL